MHFLTAEPRDRNCDAAGRPSLWDLTLSLLSPALKRWAKLVRPFGAGYQAIGFSPLS